MQTIDLPKNLPGDEKSVELIEMLLAHSPNPYDRRHFEPGHITATGLVFHPGGTAIAVVFHGRLERWLLPGGHVEATDESIEAAAAREVLEETGLVVSHGVVIGADVHGIPPKIKNGIIVEPYHQHHDILVAFQSRDTDLVLSEESSALRWLEPEDFAEFGLPPNSVRAYRRWKSRHEASLGILDSQ